MKKTIIIIVLAIGAAAALMAWGYGRVAKTAEPQSGGPGSLAASEVLYDFGTISMANGKVSHVFQITNPTDGNILVYNIQTSCMCTTAYIVKNDGSKEGPFGMPGMGGVTATDDVISGHGTQSVEVVFDPAAHGPAGIGDIDRLIDLTQENGNTLQLEIKAVVTP